MLLGFRYARLVWYDEYISGSTSFNNISIEAKGNTDVGCPQSR